MTVRYELLYKLDGFDKGMDQSESNNDIVYSNLKPGKYSLSLKLSSGSTSTEEETLKHWRFMFARPFGKVDGLRGLRLLIAVVDVFRFLNYRSQVQKERMRTFEQQKERELYRSKIDFFTNVAHEICKILAHKST